MRWTQQRPTAAISWQAVDVHQPIPVVAVSQPFGVPTRQDGASGHEKKTVRNRYRGGFWLERIVTVNLQGAIPVSWTSSDIAWAPTNGINGGGFPGANSARYALGTNGIGGGFGDDGATSYQFTFIFDYDLQGDWDDIGVGIHAQGGPGRCSTKMGVQSGGAVPNSGSLNPDCTTSVVPEPITMVLLGTGLAGLAAARRSRRGPFFSSASPGGGYNPEETLQRPIA